MSPSHQLRGRYFRNGVALLRGGFPGSLAQLPELIRDYPEWKRSMQGGTTALEDAAPWITFAARRFLDAHLPAGASVLEYGSGGSTLFFGGRAGHVISIEHDPQWFELVAARLRERGYTHCECLLVPPEHAPADGTTPDDDRGYRSAFEEYRDHTFRRYAEAADGYEDGSMDLVVVDGRARPSCIRHAHSKVKPGGYLMLDNAERDHYRSAVQRHLGTWRQYEFHGFGPYDPVVWKTTFWQRPQAGAAKVAGRGTSA